MLGHFLAVPAQVPSLQLSLRLQASPSSHAVPVGAVGVEQAPVNGSQVPKTKHAAALGQTLVSPLHTPLTQLSDLLQASPSSHGVALSGKCAQAPSLQPSVVHIFLSSQPSGQVSWMSGASTVSAASVDVASVATDVSAASASATISGWGCNVHGQCIRNVRNFRYIRDILHISCVEGDVRYVRHVRHIGSNAVQVRQLDVDYVFARSFNGSCVDCCVFCHRLINNDIGRAIGAISCCLAGVRRGVLGQLF